MNPQEDISKDQRQTEIAHLQEQFNDEFHDASLPAALVLTQQEEARQQNERALLYIP